MGSRARQWPTRSWSSGGRADPRRVRLPGPRARRGRDRPTRLALRCVPSLRGQQTAGGAQAMRLGARCLGRGRRVLRRRLRRGPGRRAVRAEPRDAAAGRAAVRGPAGRPRRSPCARSRVRALQSASPRRQPARSSDQRPEGPLPRCGPSIAPRERCKPPSAPPTPWPSGLRFRVAAPPRRRSAASTGRAAGHGRWVRRRRGSIPMR